MRMEGRPTPKTAITGRKLEPSLSKSVQEIDCNKTKFKRCDSRKLLGKNLIKFGLLL